MSRKSLVEKCNIRSFLRESSFENWKFKAGHTSFVLYKTMDEFQMLWLQQYPYYQKLPLSAPHLEIPGGAHALSSMIHHCEGFSYAKATENVPPFAR